MTLTNDFGAQIIDRRHVVCCGCVETADDLMLLLLDRVTTVDCECLKTISYLSVIFRLKVNCIGTGLVKLPTS